ncbi:hypothetical protein OIU76_022028 [Salix suchowensis]|nr:hypothetical protein OIU76_022028 [Salix suchowensis]
MTMAFLICGLVSLVVCMLVKNPAESPGYLLEDTKHLRHDFASNSGSSSPWSSDTVKVIRLDRTAFTHADILKATGNFSESRVIGKGGFGTVYRGVLPGGREVAVKKLQREGSRRRVMGGGRPGLSRATIPVVLLGSGLAEGADEMSELLRIGIGCTAEAPQRRPNMKEVLAMLIKLSSCRPSRGEIPFLRHADFQD